MKKCVWASGQPFYGSGHLNTRLLLHKSHKLLLTAAVLPVTKQNTLENATFKNETLTKPFTQLAVQAVGT